MINLEPTQRIQNISAAEFQRSYKAASQPVIIENLTQDWPARTLWDLQYIRQKAGDNIVPLYDSKPSSGRKHQHAPERKLPLSEYIDLLQQGEKDLRLFFYNIMSGAPELIRDFSYPDLGLHFFKKLPVLFLAGKGARVQMHFDIDLADLVLCHFGGQKRIMLFPPAQSHNLYHVPYSFSSLFDVDYENPDYQSFPRLQNLRGELATLQHGDALYIPPGYWHYVMYDDISFSMTLRAFPRTPRLFASMLKNILYTRTVDGLMRKFIGQAWNDRNRRLVLRETD